MRKKRILYQSDFALAKTGFGRCAKAILTYLYQTGKYEIYHYCCGIAHTGNPTAQKTPWKSFGTLPENEAEFQALAKDPKTAQMVNYGSHYIDKVVKEFKPDVYIAVQDIWGVDFAVDKKWFKQINSVLWATLDSLPILPDAIKAAKKVENFWIWSNFATKELHKIGLNHVKTMHGPIEDKFFRPLDLETKNKMREHFGIDSETFVVGFVFRNQLRKSVPNLLEGYALWKKRNPNIKSALLLHTHFGEGWQIPKLSEEYGIPAKEIMATYKCRECSNYEVSNFTTVERDCRFCDAKKGQVTANINAGVSEYQLNDVYNLMDVYCHPFTSGGQEYPIQEAKLTGLITLVTNYSCGQEMCETEARSLPLDWSEYREHGTQFRKASTCPKSIAKQLGKVFSMKPEKRTKMGMEAREWTLENYSISKVGSKIDKFIDALPTINWDEISIEEEQKDPYYQIPEIEDDKEWLVHIYQNILKMSQIDEDDNDVKDWLDKLNGAETDRGEIEKTLREVAHRSIQEEHNRDFNNLLDGDDEGKRMLYIMPQSISDVFLSTSLFESLKKQYPDYNLYVATKPENMDLLGGNPFIHKVIQYLPQMDNCFWTEGQGSHKGYFEISFAPFLSTQKNISYLHNGKDNIAFDIKV